MIFLYPSVDFCPLPPSGPEAVQSGTSALQGRGGDAQGSPASEHRPLLRLLGVAAQREEVHRFGHGADDIGDVENVSTEEKR